MEESRWGQEGRHCPVCGSLKTKTVPNEKPMPYHCGDCRKYFSVKTVSSMKLHRDLGVTQKTAWFMAQKIRQGWLSGKDDEKLDGVVEVDETYIGGINRNRHHANRLVHP